jgi:hypothetical protein
MVDFLTDEFSSGGLNDHEMLRGKRICFTGKVQLFPLIGGCLLAAKECG